MIIPALLTTNPRIAQERINQAKHMSGWLHIDVLDNTLYDFTSLNVEELLTLDFGELELEVHSMVADTDGITQSALPIARLVLHYETPNWRDAYEQSVKSGVDTWLALDPHTDLAQLDLPQDLGGVIIMGVVPGQSGQSLLPETYKRIETIKNYYPNVAITIDGGVSKDNLRKLVAHGADNVIMASALFGQSDPQAAYEEYVKLADPLALRDR